MKRISVLVVLALAAVAVASPLASLAGSHGAKGKAAVARFLVSSPHTEAECLEAIEDVSAMGTLAKWQYGCMDGDHTGYLMTNAEDAAAALAMVPEGVRAKARAVKLRTFTVAELKEAHAKMSAK